MGETSTLEHTFHESAEKPWDHVYHNVLENKSEIIFYKEIVNYINVVWKPSVGRGQVMLDRQ